MQLVINMIVNIAKIPIPINIIIIIMIRMHNYWWHNPIKWLENMYEKRKHINMNNFC